MDAESIKKWPTTTLENKIDKLTDELIDLHIAKDDGTKSKPKQAILDILLAEFNSRQSVPGAKPIKSEGTSDTRSTDMRTLETTFKESVSMFKTGQSVNTFVNQLDNCYLNNQVDATGLEVNFCRMVGSKLSDEYKTSLLHLPNTERNTWAKIKAYLLKTYETQETIYQTMAHVWNINQAPGEDIHSLGIRMEEKVMEIHRQIEAKMKKLDSEKKFDSKDAFLLMGSMLMVQRIQNKEPDAYKHMVNEIDTVVKPSQIALKAKSYIDKIGESETAAVNHGTFLANKEGKKSPDCNAWKSTGSCKYGKKCRFRHLECYKRGSSESNPPSSNSNVDKNVQNLQSKTQAEKEEKDAGKTTEQNKYPGQYFTYPPFYPYNPQYYPMPPPNTMANGQSYTVGNGKEMFEDPRYECVAQDVFGRDDDEEPNENYCQFVPDFYYD